MRRGGIVAEGPVGQNWEERYRIYRYEVRYWHDGDMPWTSATPWSARSG